MVAYAGGLLSIPKLEGQSVVLTVAEALAWYPHMKGIRVKTLPLPLIEPSSIAPQPTHSQTNPTGAKPRQNAQPTLA
jgi:hypothetical protein